MRCDVLFITDITVPFLKQISFDSDFNLVHQCPRTGVSSISLLSSFAQRNSVSDVTPESASVNTPTFGFSVKYLTCCSHRLQHKEPCSSLSSDRYQPFTSMPEQVEEEEELIVTVDASIRWRRVNEDGWSCSAI